MKQINSNEDSNFVKYKSLGGRKSLKNNDKFKTNKSNELISSKITESKFNYSSSMQ